MSATITFTDGTGAATLQSPVSAPGDRFGGWMPDVVEVGPRAYELGSGIAHQFTFRTDYVVRFELRYLTVDELTVAHRLIRHLTGGDSGTGGTCVINTDDASSRSYTCRLREGTVPALQLADARLMEWTLTLELKNTTAAPLICDYGPGS
jgi:hypothetical protein